jgi:long-chain acyl-CoA synthetase
VSERNLGCTLSGGGKPALVDLSVTSRPREYTRDELDLLSGGVVARLAEEGLQRGERVAILGANSAQFVAALLGIMRAGCVAVPVNYKFPQSTIDFIAEDAQVKLAFCDQAQARRLKVRSLPLDVDGFAATIHAGNNAAVVPELGEAGLVLYTSGSTGRPKGVELSHASQWAMVDRMGGNLADQVGIIAAPLYHMNGMLFTFMLLNAGGKAVLMPRFEAAGYLRAVADYKVNLVTGVPTMLSLLARERDLIGSLDLAGVVGVQIGSAPLSETVVKQTHAIFPNARISNGYGTTEAGAGMFSSHPDRRRTPLMSLGYPASHVEVRLVGGGSEGVLEVRTPAAMNGYLNLAEKTAEKMTTDGWINTGDIMRIDADGFYYFVGRDDDMFVCGGENIFPGEVERALERHPGIAEACVVPVADAVRGSMPVAFVTLSGDGELDVQAVKDIALASVAPHAHPRQVYFLDAMPLAGTNKIDRQALIERAKSLFG